VCVRERALARALARVLLCVRERVLLVLVCVRERVLLVLRAWLTCACSCVSVCCSSCVRGSRAACVAHVRVFRLCMRALVRALVLRARRARVSVSARSPCCVCVRALLMRARMLLCVLDCVRSLCCVRVLCALAVLRACTACARRAACLVCVRSLS
jgi:hypothetical protein